MRNFMLPIGNETYRLRAYHQWTDYCNCRRNRRFLWPLWRILWASESFDWMGLRVALSIWMRTSITSLVPCLHYLPVTVTLFCADWMNWKSWQSWNHKIKYLLSICSCELSRPLNYKKEGLIGQSVSDHPHKLLHPFGLFSNPREDKHCDTGWSCTYSDPLAPIMMLCSIIQYCNNAIAQ